MISPFSTAWLVPVGSVSLCRRNTNGRNGRTARFSSQRTVTSVRYQVKSFKPALNFGELYLCNHLVSFAQMSLEWKPTDLLSLGVVHYDLGMLSSQLMKRRKSENTGHIQYFEQFTRSVGTQKKRSLLSKNVFRNLNLILSIES